MKTIDLNDLFPAGKDGKRGPLPKQLEFMQKVLDLNGPQYVGYYGGYGSGKSLILCIVMLIQAIKYGGEYVIGRQNNPELRRTTYKTFMELIPKELIVEHRVADQELRVKSASGAPATLYWVGVEDAGKLDSLNLSGFALDEASFVGEESFLKLQGRLRNPKGLRKGIVCGNPRGKNWVYRRFVSKASLNTADAKKNYQMIVAPSTENVHLPDGYVQQMLDSYSPERVQRDIMGSFDSFEGQIYSEFNRQVHVVKPFVIPKEWTRSIGADHGYTNPAAFVWGATDYDGNLFIYREFYQREWTVGEIMKGKRDTGQPGIIALSRGESIDAIHIDPSTKARSGVTGTSPWDDYLEALPKTWGLVPAQNDVGPGIDRVKTMLKPNVRTGKPRVYIFDTCTNLLDEITEYQWDPVSTIQSGRANEKERPIKYHDHAVDAFRYLVMSRPEEPNKADALKHKLGEGTAQAQLWGEWQKIHNPEPKDPFGDSF